MAMIVRMKTKEYRNPLDSHSSPLCLKLRTLTGAAGFDGFHVAHASLMRGERESVGVARSARQ